MCVDRVCNGASKLEVDACARTIRRHQLGVHVQFVFRVGVLGLLVPFMFVLALLGRIGVQLVGEIFDDEGGIFSIIAQAVSAEGCQVSGGRRWEGWPMNREQSTDHRRAFRGDRPSSSLRAHANAVSLLLPASCKADGKPLLRQIRPVRLD